MKKKLKIGIAGCGAIGSEVAKAVVTKFKDKAELVALFDINEDKAIRLSAELKKRNLYCNLNALIKRSGLVVEATSQSASCDIVKKALDAHKAALMMSAGGILRRPGLSALAARKRTNLYIPTGAVAGIDGLSAARQGKVKKVTLTTTKPPRSFKGAPYIKEKKINLGAIKKDIVLFEGSANAAVRGFPANINVAATLSLAGIGAKKTRVRIIASPKVKRNIHEIEIEGDFGRIYTRAENVPSPRNPKTSYLAVLSAIATLDKITGNVKIGT